LLVLVVELDMEQNQILEKQVVVEDLVVQVHQQLHLQE
jgi:hypothetical protein